MVGLLAPKTKTDRSSNKGFCDRRKSARLVEALKNIKPLGFKVQRILDYGCGVKSPAISNLHEVSNKVFLYAYDLRFLSSDPYYSYAARNWHGNPDALLIKEKLTDWTKTPYFRDDRGGCFTHILASNVINVQSSVGQLKEVFNEIRYSLKIGGVFLFNYPKSPNKLDLSLCELFNIVVNEFSTAQRKSVDYKTGVFTIIK